MTVYARRFSAWAPGIHTREHWLEWAHGNREIPRLDESPPLEWAPPLFRRRLSQLSKMTVEALHRIAQPDSPVIFISSRGELDRQFTINKTLAEEAALTPAAFSLSVFNTPPALASIALGGHAPYSALYPAASFRDAFLCAAARLVCGAADGVIVVYADECIRDEYLPLLNDAQPAIQISGRGKPPTGAHGCALPPERVALPPATPTACAETGIAAAPPPLAFAAHISAVDDGAGCAIDCAKEQNALCSGSGLLRFLWLRENGAYVC